MVTETGRSPEHRTPVEGSRSLGRVIGGAFDCRRPDSFRARPRGSRLRLAVTRAIQSAGLAISDLVGRVLGEVQTRLKPSMPHSSTTARTSVRRPGTDGAWRPGRAACAAPCRGGRRPWRGAAGTSRGSPRRSARPPGRRRPSRSRRAPPSRDITAVSRPRTSRWAGVCTSSTSDRPPSSSSASGRPPASVWAASRTLQHGRQGRRRSPARNDWISPSRWSRSQGGTAVNCVRCVSSCRQTHRRKSWGLDVEFALHVHDVRRDEQQPAAAVRAGGSSRVAGAKVSYWPRTRGDRNDSSMPSSTGPCAADGAEDRVARAVAAPLLHLLQQGLEDLPEPGDVRPDPAGTVDDQDGGVVGLLGGHTSEAPDVFTPGFGMAAKFRDDGPHLVAAHLGARPYEPGRGRHREVPVDHAGICADARHASTCT